MITVIKPRCLNVAFPCKCKLTGNNIHTLKTFLLIYSDSAATLKVLSSRQTVREEIHAFKTTKDGYCAVLLGPCSYVLKAVNKQIKSQRLSKCMIIK